MKQTLIILSLLSPFIALAEQPMKELPMYGGQHKPKVEKNKVFSKDAAQHGWKAYYEGDFDKSMRRFNQAWMFDPENPEVYWGFGLVLQKRAAKEDKFRNLRESIKWLEIAHSKNPKNGMILGDLAFAHSIIGFELKKKEEKQLHFSKADDLFERAYALTPDYPPIVAHWSQHLYFTRNYLKAKEKMKEAANGGFKFNPHYLKELEKH